MKKLTAIALVGTMIPVVATAGVFGIPGVPDIVWDPTSVAEIAKDVEALSKLYDLEQGAQETATQMAAFVRNPGDVRNALAMATTEASAAVHLASTGSDRTALARLDQTLSASRGALQQAIYTSGSMSTANTVRLAQMVTDEANLLNKRDQLNRKLQEQARIDELNNEGVGDLGDVSDTLKGRILK